MQLPGGTGVLFANDFISVTKTDGEWQHLRPAVLGVVTEFYLSRRAFDRDRRRGFQHEWRVLRPEGRGYWWTAIKELIETRVRPAVANDGGDIIFKGSATAPSISR